MSTPSPFTSGLGATVASYLALKEALGRRYDGERRILSHLDTFLTAIDADLTTTSFPQWCRTREHLRSGVRRHWMRVVRNLCLYRQRSEPHCFVPDVSQFPTPHQAVRPHIFTAAEVNRLLAAAAALQPSNGSPLRPENLRLAIVLLYTTGLRRGELVRLTIGDYDPTERTLLVRESKFHKSRLLPLSPDGAAAVQSLLDLRRTRGLPASAETPLLWNRCRGSRAYSGGGFGMALRALFRATGIHTAAGGIPRVHDFRHGFAVLALLRWYRAGEDVQARLPRLATYMGHVSILSTAYYLQFIDLLEGSASERFAQRYGALVTAPLVGPPKGGA